MKRKTPRDPRNPLWAELERDIQRGAYTKDRRFRLMGPWKKFWRREKNFSVYLVDGDWVRTNLSIIFGHGGHGFVHEFIPHDELWVVTHHFSGCGCRNVKRRKTMSLACRQSTALHERVEYEEMKKGRKYWPAHKMALHAERVAGFLPSPYTEA